MARFIARRLVATVITMLLVSVVIFVLSEAAPGNVARNVLGQFATPEQEASFRAQLGLDRPLPERYFAWLLGSDRRAARLVGLPLTTIVGEGGYPEWWAVGEDGTLLRWKLEGTDLIQIRRRPDGTVEEALDNQRWRTGDDGVRSAWVVDRQNRAVHYVLGEDVTVWVRARGAGWWVPQTGGAVEYIPLQRGMLRGDPGHSIQTGRAIGPALQRRLTNSLTLAAAAFVVVMPLALLLGIVAGVNRGRPIDRLLSVGALITTGTPQFATGIFLILIFTTWLNVLPGAAVFDRPDAIWANPTMLVLPVATLALIELGYILRITRASMIEVMDSPYVRTAILKGLPMGQVVLKHALRNALLAPITVIMLHINWLIGGIVVTESIFGFPGVGGYLYDAAMYKDVFALQAGTLVMVACAAGTQLLADVIYTFLNPRIRYG